MNAIFALAILTFVLAWIGFRLMIPLAHRWSLCDIPSSRRRHSQPMPIIGGIALFTPWILILGLYSILRPAWFLMHYASMLSLLASIAVLITAGFLDDVKGLSPLQKLTSQFFASLILVFYNPYVYDFCIRWSDHIGIIVWPLAILWLMALSNAINLVDGLDGLAGGISAILCGALIITGLNWGGKIGDFTIVILTFLIPAIIGFLFFNWHPAKVFLGDNGSLPLGFLIGATSLMAPPKHFSWLYILSMILMMGYPILDMVLCVARRFKAGNPLFKADRNHLHHRILRLGLSVHEACGILLIITLYLVLTAICVVEFMRTHLGIVFMIATGLGLFSMIYIVRAMEKLSVARVFDFTGSQLSNLPNLEVYKMAYYIGKIDIEPLLEAGLLEEQYRIDAIVTSLILMLKGFLRADDKIFIEDKKIVIIFSTPRKTAVSLEDLRYSLRERLNVFQKLYDLQYSLADLPVSFKKGPMFKTLRKKAA